MSRAPRNEAEIDKLVDLLRTISISTGGEARTDEQLREEAELLAQKPAEYKEILDLLGIGDEEEAAARPSSPLSQLSIAATAGSTPPSQEDKSADEDRGLAPATPTA